MCVWVTGLSDCVSVYGDCERCGYKSGSCTPAPPRVPILSFQSPSPTWWLQLNHLDLSGQLSIRDDVLGSTLNRCSNLTTLSIADTAAAALTFMMWPTQHRGGGSSSSSSGCGASSTATAAADAAAVNPPQPSDAAAAAGHEDERLTAAGVAAAPACTLQVLDVSGCAALAGGGATSASAAAAAVFRCFQAALGAMPHLEGTDSRRLPTYFPHAA